MTDFQKLDVLKHELSRKMSAARPAIAMGNSVVLHEETRRARGTYQEILQVIQAAPDANASLVPTRTSRAALAAIARSGLIRYLGRTDQTGRKSKINTERKHDESEDGISAFLGNPPP